MKSQYKYSEYEYRSNENVSYLKFKVKFERAASIRLMKELIFIKTFYKRSRDNTFSCECASQEKKINENEYICSFGWNPLLHSIQFNSTEKYRKREKKKG